jgi:hypothetical protein
VITHGGELASKLRVCKVQRIRPSNLRLMSSSRVTNIRRNGLLGHTGKPGTELAWGIKVLRKGYSPMLNGTHAISPL